MTHPRSAFGAPPHGGNTSGLARPVPRFACRGWVVAVLFAGMQCMPARADDAAAQRERIASERAAAQAAYETQTTECQQRFVVTPCMAEARRQRRDALDRLQRQQVLLDEAQRRQRAAARMDAIRNKVAAEAASTRLPPRPPAATLRLRDGEALPPREGASAPSPHQPAAHAAAAEQARLTRRDEQQARQSEAQAHREVVERRNAQRLASGKKAAAPLPAAPASAPR